MRINAKVYHVFIKVLLGIVILVLVTVFVFLGFQISGRNRLYGRNDQTAPDLGQSALAEEVFSGKEGAGRENDNSWQEGDIRYQGTIYRYNQDILTFLFLGIDKMEEAGMAEDGIDGGQSDAIFLLVLNPHTKEASVIGIPRDTMTDVEVYGMDGNYLGTQVQQICLQHSYGDGGKLSCERSKAAVAGLFYDLPIHGYCAISMEAIPVINDAVGGVDVVALEDVIVSSIKKGDTVHLEGMEAYQYLHNRDITSSGSAAGRLERQKQYLTAYAAKALEAMKTDITLPVTLYSTLSRYMVTDITIDEVSYLATQAGDYHFSGENMYSLEGEITTDGKYEQFHADEKALYELILEVFYEKVEQ